MKAWVKNKQIELIMIAAAIAVAAVWGLVSVASKSPAISSTRAVATPSVASGPRGVIYELGGTAESADITMQTATGTRQEQGVDVPLQTKDGASGLTLTGLSPGAFVYVSAQNHGSSGSITCRIRDAATRDILSENTSSDAYAIASCSGRAR